ncbi:MAG: cell division protein ZapA [Sphingopyxis sp.]
MAEVALNLGGRSYTLSCADGEEAALVALGSIIEDKIQNARQRVGELTETRQFLFAAILLADELETARAAAAPAPSPTIDPTMAPIMNDQMGQLATSIDSVAQRLEGAAQRLAQIAHGPLESTGANA